MGVDITTKVAPGTSTPDLRELVQAYHASLRPMHPGTRDPELGSYVIVHVPDAASAERLLAQLRQHPAVTAAYIKPPDAMA